MKKQTKKLIKKSKVTLKVKVKPVKTKKEKPIGVVTHYYGGIGVAIVKFKQPVKLGAAIRFKGSSTDFAQAIKSMQYDHKDISAAKKGQEVGVKVSKKAREGDEVYAG